MSPDDVSPDDVGPDDGGPGLSAAHAQAFDDLALSRPTRAIARPKLNLGLRILGRRADGYHLLDSVFVSIAGPVDVLHMARSSREGATVLFSSPGLDAENNTLTKAWRVFAERTGHAPPLVVHVDKRIPWGAGLGGGSADAACLIAHLAEDARAHGLELSDGLLNEIGAAVGADVPFFYRGRPARVTGIGEIMEPIMDPVLVKGLEKMVVLLAMPDLRVSTPWAYRAFDEMMENAGRGSAGREEAQGHEQGHEQGGGIAPLEALTLATNLCMQGVPVGGPPRPVELVNDLEGPVFRRHPELCAIKAHLLRHGALAASMTGSGSCVFGLFSTEAVAERARTALDCPSTLTSFLTEPL